MKSKNCSIYAASNLSENELVFRLADGLVGICSNLSIIEMPGYEISINRNDEFNEEKQKVFPDGFLFFRFIIDLDFVENNNINPVSEVNRVLTWFWENNYPAIASCDYEVELLNKGGYNSVDVPWIK